MKKLLVDAGNTSLKWAFLETSLGKDSLTQMQSCAYGKQTPSYTFRKVLEQQLNTQKIDEIILVSVLGDAYISTTEKLAKQQNIKFISIQSSQKLAGVTSAYGEPHKLGADRLVAIIAAYHLKPNQASIVVDTGTATTIDAIDINGQHLGGLILPGLEICSESLLENTKMLTAFNKSKSAFEPNIFAKNTKQAIASGSLFGLVGAITNICLTMEKAIRLNNSHIININKIICGGSAYKLTPYLSNDFNHHNDLLMQGLKIITKHHMKTN